MSKTVKDLTDLELGIAAFQGQQDLIRLQVELDMVLKEMTERNNKIKEEVKEEKPEQEGE